MSMTAMGKRKKFELQTKRRQKIRLSPEHSDYEEDYESDTGGATMDQPPAYNPSQPVVASQSSQDEALMEFLKEIEGIEKQSEEIKQTIPNPEETEALEEPKIEVVWHEMYDSYYDCFYYWNSVTHESVWVKPNGAIIIPYTEQVPEPSLKSDGPLSEVVVDEAKTDIENPNSKDMSVEPHTHAILNRSNLGSLGQICGEDSDNSDSASDEENDPSVTESIDVDQALDDMLDASTDFSSKISSIKSSLEKKFEAYKVSWQNLAPLWITYIKFQARCEDFSLGEISEEYFCKALQTTADQITTFENSISSNSKLEIKWREKLGEYVYFDKETGKKSLEKPDLSVLIPANIRLLPKESTEDASLQPLAPPPLPVDDPSSPYDLPPPPPPPPQLPPEDLPNKEIPQQGSSGNAQSLFAAYQGVELADNNIKYSDDENEVEIAPKGTAKDFTSLDVNLQYKLYKKMKKLAKYQKEKAKKSDHGDSTESTISGSESDERSRSPFTSQDSNAPSSGVPSAVSTPPPPPPDEGIVYCLPSNTAADTSNPLSKPSSLYEYTELCTPNPPTASATTEDFTAKKKKDKVKGYHGTKYKKKNMNSLVDKWSKVQQEIEEDPDLVEGSYNFAPQSFEKYKKEQLKASTENPNMIDIGDWKTRLKDKKQ